MRKFKGFNIDYSKLDPETARAFKQLIAQSQDIVRDMEDSTTDTVINDHSKLSSLDYSGSGHTGFSASRQIAILRDEKSQGTNGGSSSAGANTRVLNTSHYNNISGCSLGSNQVTLPAGTYIISAFAVLYNGSYSQLTLYNNTTSATALVGLANYPITVSFIDQLDGVITITGTSVFSLVHYIYNAVATYGLGVAANYNTEVYAQIIIEKIG